MLLSPKERGQGLVEIALAILIAFVCIAGAVIAAIGLCKFYQILNIDAAC